MLTITAIAPNTYYKKRFAVFVDGVFYSGISAENLKNLGLTEGQTCEADYLRKNVIEAEKKECLAFMLKVLDTVAATEAQLVRKAKKKSFCYPVIEYAINRLKDFRLLDDYQIAENFVRANASKKGAFRLAQELKLKGITDEDAEKAIASVEDTEEENAYILAKKRIKNKDVSVMKEREALTRFLLYRGFSFTVVKNVLRRLNVDFIGDDDE